MEHLITVYHPYSHEDIVLQSKEACKTDFHLTDIGVQFSYWWSRGDQIEHWKLLQVSFIEPNAWMAKYLESRP